MFMRSLRRYRKTLTLSAFYGFIAGEKLSILDEPDV